VSKLPGAHDKLSPEFELIARLSAGIRVSRRTILGIGDDCAIVSRPSGPALLTIDSLVENVHFDLRWCPSDALGARALAVNLSDIAAMGGRPTAAVVNLAVRDGISTRTLERIYTGLRKSAQWAEPLHAVAEKYGVEPSIIVSIWGIESSFGQASDHWDVFRSLATSPGRRRTRRWPLRGEPGRPRSAVRQGWSGSRSRWHP